MSISDALRFRELEATLAELLARLKLSSEQQLLLEEYKRDAQKQELRA
jgi:hypothetical protein